MILESASPCSTANTPSRARSPAPSVSGTCLRQGQGSLTISAAYGVFKINNTRLHNWQYLFIIEGGITILLGIIAWFWLPHGPESAWFLNAKDRQFAAERILQDNVDSTGQDDSGGALRKSKLSKLDVIETLRDWKLWYVLVFNICASVPSQAFSVFLPLVVQGLGYSSLQANLVCSFPLPYHEFQALMIKFRCPFHRSFAEQRPCTSSP